jgi:glyoxylase-like metal-dependent hydrolase (beta-lactamase superfamily II)
VSAQDHGSTSTLYLKDTGVEIHKLVVGPMDNNVWIVRCTQTGEGLLIDAANEHERLLPLCKTLGVRKVLETHGHWDHIQAVPAVREAGIDVAVREEDAGMLPSYDLLIPDDEVITVGRLRLKTHHTPGHTPGSVCFSLEGVGPAPILFSGDTLFPGGPGNTSLPGGDFDTIIESIESRIFSVFPGETLVLPGHGDSTTVGTESPHLDEWIERRW